MGRWSSKSVGKEMMIAAAVVMLVAWMPRADAADSLSFPPTNFTILDPATGVQMGRSRYSIASAANGAILHGDDRYDTGLWDIETSRLTLAVGSGLPLLVDFDHTFYNADGSIQQRSHVDMGSGLASCTDNAGSPQVNLSQTLSIPADTWAGAAVVIPIQHFLRAGNTGAFKLHVFNCAPGPKIFAIDIATDPAAQNWAAYGGDALRVEVRPNLGWFNVLIAPFLPKLHAWFDPRDQWGFVGSEAARYYKGPKIMLVKAHTENGATALRGAE